MMELPKKITPSPVIEVLAEFKIRVGIPSSVLLGKIYEKLIVEFPKFEELPILSMPEQLRQQEPAFVNAPHYRFSNDNYLVHVGDRILSINEICTSEGSEYSGWKSLSSKVKQVVEIFQELDIQINTDAITLRYINFFQLENFKDIVKVDVTVGALNISEAKDFAIKIDSDSDDITKRVTVATDSSVNTLEGDLKKGQTIAIEAIKDGNTAIEEWTSSLESMHDSMDQLFFSLMTNDFIEGLSPEY